MSSDTFYEEPKLLNTLVSFDQDADGKTLYITKNQEVPDSFLADLADRRLASTNMRANDFYLAASIPIAVVEELLTNYGFDVMTAPISETMAMLRRRDLDQFIATQKRI